MIRLPKTTESDRESVIVAKVTPRKDHVSMSRVTSTLSLVAFTKWFMKLSKLFFK